MSYIIIYPSFCRKRLVPFRSGVRLMYIDNDRAPNREGMTSAAQRRSQRRASLLAMDEPPARRVRADARSPASNRSGKAV